MATNEIKLVIKIDGKDAIGAIQLTDKNIKELYQSFKYGQQIDGYGIVIHRLCNNDITKHKIFYLMEK